jgi:hypothetical protein
MLLWEVMKRKNVNFSLFLNRKYAEFKNIYLSAGIFDYLGIHSLSKYDMKK